MVSVFGLAMRTAVDRGREDSGCILAVALTGAAYQEDYFKPFTRQVGKAPATI